MRNIKMMKKEERVKKWIKQCFLDGMRLNDVTENIENAIDFYYWERNDPRLKAFNALKSRVQRREHLIFVHFGFKKGKIWSCEADYKVRRLFHNFCHEPDTLYEMLSIRAEDHLQQQACTLRSWLDEAARTDKPIYDVPEVLYKPVHGWHDYMKFVWSAFKDGVIDMDQLLYEMQAVKTIHKKKHKDPVTSDALVNRSVVDTLKLLKWYMISLPNSREAHDIAEENRKRIFERNGIDYNKLEYNEDL
jgi:hypothetical protein